MKYLRFNWFRRPRYSNKHTLPLIQVQEFEERLYPEMLMVCTKFDGNIKVSLDFKYNTNIIHFTKGIINNEYKKGVYI